MTSLYDTRKNELTKQIASQKTIYKFRVFMYSLNKDIRKKCFDISRDFLLNESLNNNTIAHSEKTLLQQLIDHWEWNSFDNNSTNWWSTLSYNHSNSRSLMVILHLWIDDINEFDMETFETSTLGIR